jgi:hypothetical protein
MQLRTLFEHRLLTDVFTGFYTCLDSKVPSERYEKHRNFVVKSLGIDGRVHGFESRLESVHVCFRGVLRQSPRAS